DLLLQGADAGADRLLDVLLAGAQLEQFVGHVERGDDGDPVQADDLARVADLAHLGLEQLGGRHEIVAFVLRAGDQEFLVQDAHRYRLRYLAHALCSIALRRLIMASTRVRASSLRSMSWARSVVMDSC